MRKKIPLAVIFFAKGDADDGGVESILTLLEDVLPQERVVLTNYDYAEKQNPQEHFFYFAPYLELRLSASAGIFGKIKKSWPLLKANLASFKILRAVKPQQIICNDFWSFWHVAFSCLLLRTKILLFVRDTPARCSYFSYAWLIPFSLSSKVLCLSSELREVVERTPFVERICKRIFKTEFVVVPSLVVADLLELENASEQSQKDRFSLGYVASFRKKKQQLEFIRYVVLPLAKLLPNLKVTFLGGCSVFDLDYRQLCVEEVRKLGLEDCVNFVDHVEDPTPFYRLFDLTCLASSHEGLARVMIESLACATPVVSFAVCSAREVLEQHHCGVVVEIGNYKQFVSEVAALAKERDRLEFLSRNAIECIRQNYSLPVVKKMISGLL